MTATRRAYIGMATGIVAVAMAGAPAPAQEADAIVKKLRETKTFTIGHRESSIPHSYIDNSQKVIGYSIELCLKIGDAMKQELNLQYVSWTRFKKNLFFLDGADDQPANENKEAE